MEIYSIYQSFLLIFSMLFDSNNVSGIVLASLLGGCIIWLILIILQGFGLYKMGKKANVKNKWMAFLPFFNIYYMGKLAGTASVFGKRMKSPGLYAMVASIINAIFCIAAIISEILLFTKYKDFIVINEGSYIWTGLPSKFARYMYNFYDISSFIISIVNLVYSILLFILLMSLYKKYYARGYMLLSMLAIFFPISRYIVVFVLRNNKAIDYDAYMKAKQEEFMRRVNQNTYNNPNGYNQNGGYNPNGYNQNGGYNPNGYNPNGGNNQNNNVDEPFAEFSSNKNKTNSNYNNVNSDSNNTNNDSTNSSDSGNSSDDYDLFN